MQSASSNQRYHAILDPEDLTFKDVPLTPLKKSNLRAMTTSKLHYDKPRLIHESLHKIPQPIRFQIAGAINTLGFLLSSFVFNKFFHETYTASTLYLLSSVAYFPIGHANTSLMVFGWPSPYLPNLIMNMPIAFGGIAIGTICTGILDQLAFDDFMRSLLSGLRLMTFEEDDDGNMFSSLLVMIVTGVWGYVLSTMVNGKKSTKKKTDKGDKDL